jgi:hypothetical protein
MDKARVSKEEALCFLLTYLVVERNTTLELTQTSLFELSNLAQQAVDRISESDGVIPHEVIETLAASYLE